MNFNPAFTIASVARPEGRTEVRCDESLKKAILALVEQRHRAIRQGDRETLDRTYVGLDSRDYSLQREDHERTSYYDWYMNRIERGMGSEITAIRVIPIYDFLSLPFKYNANWTLYYPEFELQIQSSGNQTSWYITRARLTGGEIRVILPNFADAPWKAPIIETRGQIQGGPVEFNGHTFAKKLATHIGLELCTWGHWLHELVRIRAFALNVDPSKGVLQPCLLTDKENFDEAEYGKWSLNSWRLFDFALWEYTDEFIEVISKYSGDKPHDHQHPKFASWVQPKEDFEILLACVQALREPDFQMFMERFDLTTDFEIGVFHGHDEQRACNFVKPENQDLSVLIRVESTET